MINRLVNHIGFDSFILMVILINSASLALETLVNLSASTQQLLIYIDVMCLIIFVIEAVLKLSVYRSSYFKSGWNLFDFIIVVISLLPVSHFISVLRSLRILRAFRLIAHVPALKRVVSALAISIPGLLSTACLLLLVFFVFGVMGVKLFGGHFPEWFGHLGRAMFSLFQIMTLESWSMGIARPIMAIYPYAWLYFIPFILISAFTLLNFLIGIVVDALAYLKSSEEREAEQIRTDELLRRLDRIEKLLEDKK
ncbi:Ion transport protein [Piscirickettsia salmonis]|uniref:Ion transport family protein n=1 Tax=Piscirickettsia salmonis TaxID=1238 RepID=A0A1L6TG62_PISSA|nr:ion transporter [Piscirickettsia salmonis]AKP74707.1 ion transporter [Piscirickettsia salmonis LF-89 = ATCC VR-1361]ALB21368.1 ion transport family protein [Piscirickettsia salmonis]ALY01606.1 ion transporter [Piscirickettsia salmonis]AMA41118.1 ion transporter [Piscirickettsia salmonis]AOS36308.1 ion transporter [Piscirickettsia salmonis]